MVNQVVKNLPPYPMEELTRIKRDLKQKGAPIYDFGTGDPRIPTWPKIRDALKSAVPEISQYPSVMGTESLMDAIWDYMHRRYKLKQTSELSILPTNGSKEAVFNIALCLIDRDNQKNLVIYPDPGYPVYRASVLFAGGTPYPVTLSEKNNFLLEPWNLPKKVQENTRALWINYPHNPTGALANEDYLKKTINWCHSNNVVLLSDDCYADIYDPRFDNLKTKDKRPLNPICYDSKNIISFMSLSKRSGFTGYRSGFMIGDKNLLDPIKRARANFGVGTPTFIQQAAEIAWRDDQHVHERREIFSKRLAMVSRCLKEMGMPHGDPEATFYLWCKIPGSWGEEDVKFCLELASIGIISSPSQWLSEGIRGWMRLAMVPEEEDIKKAMGLMKDFVTNQKGPS